MSVIRSRVIGCGHYLPEKVLSNLDLSKMVETNDEWIRERTGIKQRHIAADNELTSDLAFKASKMALEKAGIKGEELDMIVIGTTTPDNTFPAVAARLQAMLGMPAGKVAFDVQAACSGFVFALSTADNAIKLGEAKNVLVVGAETLSRIVDWNDRNTCVLFGDGAGAVVLSADKGKGSMEDKGILKVNIHTDGYQYDTLYATGGPGTTQTSGYITMNGREVFRHAVTNLVDTAKQTLRDCDLTTQDVDWLLPHQANLRIIDGTAKKLGISEEKVIVSVDRHANTSAASIPLALSEAVNDGRIKDNQLIVIDAMGGGFTWGSALIRM